MRVNLASTERQRSVNRASTEHQQLLILLLGYSKGNRMQLTHNPPICSLYLLKILLMILSPPPTMEHPQSINNFGGGSASITAMKCIALFPNLVLRGQFWQYILVYNFTNMHALSHRSDYFARSSRVNFEEHAFCFIIMWLSAVSQVRLPSFLIATTMSDSKSFNTSF